MFYLDLSLTRAPISSAIKEPEMNLRGQWIKKREKMEDQLTYTEGE